MKHSERDNIVLKEGKKGRCGDDRGLLFSDLQAAVRKGKG